MAAFNKAILTIKGNNLIAGAVAGDQIEFTRLETGSGIYDGTENLPSMDRLKNKQQEFYFLRYEKASEDSILLVAMVSNEGLAVGYRMTEIGIYGKLKNSEEEILCSVAITDEADFIPPFNGLAPTRILLHYHMTISPDAEPCILVADDIIMKEISAESNRAYAAEMLIKRQLDKMNTDLNPVAFSGNYEDLTGVPAKLSEFENDRNYVCSENPEFTGVPTAPTAPTNTNNGQIATTAFVKGVVAMLVNGASEDLDTLKEIEEALKSNRTFMDALNAAIGGKVDKVSGKGLSTNDFTNNEKAKLGGIATGATKNSPSSTVPKASGTASTGSESAYARGDHVHPEQESVSGNAGTASKWDNERNIDGLIIDGSSNRSSYGTCSTAAATAAKTVSCIGFGLVMGAEITIRFTVTNTAANPTLNVNGTGAKPIYYRGAAIYAGYLAVNRTYIFRYNGMQYDLVGDIDTNATYNNMSGATESANGKAGLVPAPGAGKQNAYLRGDGTWVTPTKNLLGTEPGIPLDQTMGKDLKDDIDELYSKLDTIGAFYSSSKLVNSSIISGTNNYVAVIDGLPKGTYILRGLMWSQTTQGEGGLIGGFAIDNSMEDCGSATCVGSGYKRVEATNLVKLNKTSYVAFYVINYVGQTIDISGGWIKAIRVS